MNPYLDKTSCKKFLKKTMATSYDKLCKISEINDRNDIEYTKLLLELQILNNIIENVQKYMDELT
jgi:hypothetical protein